MGNNPLNYVDPTGNTAKQSICDEACKESRRQAKKAKKEAKALGIDTVTIDHRQKKDKPVPDPEPTFDEKIDALKRMEAHGNNEMTVAGARHLESWFRYKTTIPDFSPAYVQAEVDLPIKGIYGTGLALQFTHDRNGNFYFGPGQYVGSPGGNVSVGWLKPNAPPSIVEGFIEQESTGGAVILPCLKNPFIGIGAGATYASGQVSPQFMVGVPGASYNVTYSKKITNTGWKW